jgi:hypothetical protein
MGRKLDGKIGRIEEPPKDDFSAKPGAVTFLELLDCRGFLAMGCAGISQGP